MSPDRPQRLVARVHRLLELVQPARAVAVLSDRIALRPTARGGTVEGVEATLEPYDVFPDCAEIPSGTRLTGRPWYWEAGILIRLLAPR